MSPAKGTSAAPRRRGGAAKKAPAATKRAAKSPYADGYEGLNWDLFARARVGSTRTAVGAGLVSYGIWMQVVRASMPQPAEPDAVTGAVLQ